MAQPTPAPTLDRSIEPWLRGTLTDAPVVLRGVLHALQLAREDIDKWCSSLSHCELNARPGGIAPVAFHLCHIARSADRLLTYAEGHQLDATQLERLQSELQSNAVAEQLFAEFTSTLQVCASRIHSLAGLPLELPRFVGRKQLPTTLGGLLIHVAEHTQRHVGQAITTAKIVMSQRQKQSCTEEHRK